MRKLTFLLGPALVACTLLLCGPRPASAQAKSAVVEDIIARVNNEIITMSDYQKSLNDLVQEVQQDCQGCTRDRMLDELKTRQKDLLRDMIDQQLLIERAKDMAA